LVNEAGTAWLLEVNAFPDFGQTGAELRGLVGELWEEVIEKVVGGFFGEGNEEKKEGEGEGLVLVKSVELGRR